MAYVDLACDATDPVSARQSEAAALETLPAGGKWEDPDFGDGHSLYFNMYMPPMGALPSDQVEWNRLSAGAVSGCAAPATYTGAPLRAEGDDDDDAEMDAEATPTCSVRQGALGDCWLLSAMAMVATRPALLKSLIVSDLYAHRGMYTAKLWKQGAWRYVHVDDRVPCSRSGKPQYGRSADTNETWAVVLEKAYAKLHGCYQALDGGHVDAALRDLTGTPCLRFDLDRAGPLAQAQAKAGFAPLWAELLELQGSGALLGGLYCPAGGDDGGLQAKRGVVSGHAYPVLDLKEARADATSEYDALEVRMVKLQNPWGQGEWSGDWCAGHKLWSEYPMISQALGVDAASSAPDPSVLWMEWGDYCAMFNVVVASIPDWSAGKNAAGSAARYRGQWVPGDPVSGAGGAPPHASVRDNPQFGLELNQTTRVAVSVAALDQRWSQRGARAYSSSVGFVVMKLSGAKSRSTLYHPSKMVGQSRWFAARPAVADVCTLGPGRYAIVPCTAQPGSTSEPFVLEVVTDKEAAFDIESQTKDLAALPDDNLAESDDEELGPALPTAVVVAGAASCACDPEDGGKAVAALSEQAADLADYLAALRADVAALEDKVVEMERK